MVNRASKHHVSSVYGKGKTFRCPVERGCVRWGPWDVSSGGNKLIHPQFRLVMRIGHGKPCRYKAWNNEVKDSCAVLSPVEEKAEQRRQ